MKSSLAINIHDKREKNPSGKVFHEDFLSFEVNIMCSAEQSSVYCHYFLFFGHHNHSISTPRGEYGQYQPLGVNIQHFSLLEGVILTVLKSSVRLAQYCSPWEICQSTFTFFKVISARLYDYVDGRGRVKNCRCHIQCSCSGWPTGNGKKLSNSQACCLAQLCQAAA